VVGNLDKDLKGLKAIHLIIPIYEIVS